MNVQYTNQDQIINNQEVYPSFEDIFDLGDVKDYIPKQQQRRTTYPEANEYSPYNQIKKDQYQSSINFNSTPINNEEQVQFFQQQREYLQQQLWIQQQKQSQLLVQKQQMEKQKLQQNQEINPFQMKEEEIIMKQECQEQTYSFLNSASQMNNVVYDQFDNFDQISYPDFPQNTKLTKLNSSNDGSNNGPSLSTTYENTEHSIEIIDAKQEALSGIVEEQIFLESDYNDQYNHYSQQQYCQSVVRKDHSNQRKITQIKNNNKLLIKKSIQKSGSQSAQTKKPTSYCKNICRYLTRKTIRCFASNEYKKKVKDICKNNSKIYKGATEYFLENIENISGFKAVKEYLDIERESDLEIREYKTVFKIFYTWFLKNRIVRYILTGDMEHKDVYIGYKNQVMLKYVNNLQFWNQQEPEKFKIQIKNSDSESEKQFTPLLNSTKPIFKLIRH